MENKQAICDKICEALRLTDNAGRGNALKELRYIKVNEDKQLVRPVFENGSGEDGYYDVDVSWDSGTAMIYDITRQFVNKMW